MTEIQKLERSCRFVTAAIGLVYLFISGVEQFPKNLYSLLAIWALVKGILLIASSLSLVTIWIRGSEDEKELARLTREFIERGRLVKL